jgi:hypothetical protein
MHDKKQRGSYEDEAKAKGGSVPPDLRRNSKARSEATQDEHMGGHNKQEQKDRQRQHMLERDLEESREDIY